MNDASDPQSAKILIVDDKTANLDLLREMLVPAGYSIFFATSGQKALRVAEQVHPDLILLDVMMPDMDGLTVCRHLKDQEALRDVPVVFVTARTDVEDLVKGFEAGGVDYVTKPVKQPEVYARVKTHLKVRALIEQQKAHLAALDRAKRELEVLNETKDKFLSNLGKELGAAAAKVGAVDGSAQDTEAKSQGQEVLRLMGAILEWPRLQTGQKLDLLATEISDRELGSLLDSLHDLRFLSLAETRVGDDGLKHLLSLTELEELHLDYSEITDAGVALLASLPKLRILDLKGTKISDEGLAHLGGLHQLEGLYLTRTSVTDAGMVYLSSLTKLKTLILWDTAVSDGGLTHLTSLTELKELILWNTKVTQQGASALQQALPDCDVSTSLC